MYDESDDYGQFIEIEIFIDSNIKKNDDIILPKTKENTNIIVNVFINVFCFIIICMLFYNIYVSPPLK
jgi:hypothetical protein